ncbi:TM104-like protein [Mya arenaria]|uniref:TM104-like protein n=1 Tax=Mya arenaria TaxID=6604 RepID=A0ABY7DG33_MYAAR|nr:TM104-like protein [Mya arenaria]
MVNPGISETGEQYSKTVGLIFIFNLIVGTGALTMPRAFAAAGWLLSLITIIVLSFMSYMTVTFVTEAMSIANAINKKKDGEDHNGALSPFEITERTELKTKYLQLVTSLSRWIAFGMMIVLAVIRIGKKKGQGHPSVADISGVPNLFGVCVYSFMCHHSLPSLITPIKNKSRLYALLASDYFLILIFYLLVSLTGIFAFNSIEDIYTLNFFKPDSCDESNSITNVKFIEYFLALFPVFTLSTNFPIISITLRNNLKALGYKENRPYPFWLDRICFPLLALVPPMGIALATNEVEFLVGITGSYAGAAIQYVIPTLLVFYARKQVSECSPQSQIHASPFKSFRWIVFVCIWAALCIIFVTVNHIITRNF